MPAHAAELKRLLHRLLEWTGLLGSYAMCFFVGWSVAGVNLTMAVLILAMVLRAGEAWPLLRQWPLFWLMTLTTVYICIQSAILAAHYPALAEASNPHWSDVAQVTGVISLPLAWWMMRNPRHLPWFLAIAAAGVIFGLVREANWEQGLAAGLGRRRTWGNPAGMVGYMSGLVVIGALIWGTRTALYAELLRRRAWTHIALAAILAAAAAIPFISARTRGAWIALAVVVAVYMIAASARLLHQHRHRRRVAVLAIVLLVPVAVLASLDAAPVLMGRLDSLPSAVSALFSANLQALIEFERSLGVRVEMWLEGLRAVAERPLFGWGLGGKPLVQAWSGNPIGGSGQFHSIYVEILAGLGLLGGGLFAATLVTLFVASARGGPTQSSNTSVHTVSLGLSVYSAIYFTVDTAVGHAASRAAVILILALLMVPVLRGRRQQVPGEHAAQPREEYAEHPASLYRNAGAA